MDADRHSAAAAVERGPKIDCAIGHRLRLLFSTQREAVAGFGAKIVWIKSDVAQGWRCKELAGAHFDKIGYSQGRLPPRDEEVGPDRRVSVPEGTGQVSIRWRREQRSFSRYDASRDRKLFSSLRNQPLTLKTGGIEISTEYFFNIIEISMSCDCQVRAW